MPDIDLNEVLTDPDLCDTFQVQRRTDAVSTDTGRPVITTTLLPDLQYGVITPEDGSQNRVEDAQTSARSIQIITPFRLRVASEGVQPDEVLYDGQVFTVTSVKGWHRFGRGFIVATATVMQPSVTPLV